MGQVLSLQHVRSTMIHNARKLLFLIRVYLDASMKKTPPGVLFYVPIRDCEVACVDLLGDHSP
jgi:hypothetical protein